MNNELSRMGLPKRHHALFLEETMLSEAQRNQVRELCKKKKCGMIEFLPDGSIRFSGMTPLETSVQRTFPYFRVIDSGSSVWEDRIDDMKQGYWVTVRPDFD